MTNEHWEGNYLLLKEEVGDMKKIFPFRLKTPFSPLYPLVPTIRD
jgi:hypothetical protein